jgi:hypothetical protein
MMGGMHWWPQKTLANQIDIFPRTSIDHMEHAHHWRLNRRKHLQCPADLFSIGTVQTTKNAHSNLLALRLQEQPHRERPGEQHQWRHDNANLEVVEPRYIDMAMAQD